MDDDSVTPVARHFLIAEPSVRFASWSQAAIIRFSA